MAEQRKSSSGQEDILSVLSSMADNSNSSLSPDSRTMAADRQHNVRLMMFFTGISTLFFSICQWNVFDAYLSLLAKDKRFFYRNSWVGFAESISGLVALVVAIPVGILVDTVDRVMLCRCAAVLGVVASIVSFFSFAFDSIIGLMINLLMWGIFAEVTGSATQALFADSLTPGNRSRAMTMNGMIATAGLSLGPAFLILLFFVTGNKWSLQELHIPLLMGCCIAPFSCILLWWFRNVVSKEDEISNSQETGNAAESDSLEDKTFESRLEKTYESNNTNVKKEAPRSPPRPPIIPSPHTTPKRPVGPASASPVLRRLSLIGSEAPDFSLEEQDKGGMHRRGLSGAGSGTIDEATGGVVSGGRRWAVDAVPYIVAGSDFIRKIGAGMTVKFFALFFIQDYHFEPVHVSILFCVYPLCISFFMHIVQSLSQPLGRVQAVTLWQILGIVSLVAMVYIEDIHVLLVVFLLRGSFSNAVYPIDRSIIMDYVPSSSRGKWNAVESLTSMTWSGSAVLGGFLADMNDYRYTFKITAVIYVVSLVAYLPLLWMVPRDEKAARVAVSQKKDESISIDCSTASSIATSSLSCGRSYKGADNNAMLTTSLLSSVQRDGPTDVSAASAV
eukprot:GHVS01007908.1.p1 GENE.GHVS01007908.1~~GHVS01007908.1.p1  ORF type:complete len:616 (-),score=92.13 GHVS01007908.1:1110-2957(-)